MSRPMCELDESVVCIECKRCELPKKDTTNTNYLDNVYEQNKKEFVQAHAVKPYEDPITPKDLMELSDIGIEPYDPQVSIINLVIDAYPGAESIEINPKTREIHIKMKG